MADVTVRLKALDGTWEVCGADRARGVWPENVSGIRADGWGSKTVGFDLRRDPKAIWPDIAAFTRVQIDVDGVLRWSGRVAQTPVRDDLDSVISVQCEGMQAHLDDDLYERIYAHTRLADWKDARSVPDAHLGAGYACAAGQVSTDGAITLTFPKDTAVVSNSTVQVTLDLGASRASRVVVGLDLSNDSADATVRLYGSNAAGEAQRAYDLGDLTTGASVLNNAGTPNSLRATFTTPVRYVMIALQWTGASATTTADVWARITSALVVADTAYETGDVSILQSDDVVLDAVSRGTILLSSDRSKVAAGTFNIPEFAPSEPRTPRQVWEAADAFEDRLKKIDLQDRPVYAAKPTTPVVEVGAWSAMSFEDASANDGSEVYSRVIVVGTQPDGSPLRVERTQAQQPSAVFDLAGAPQISNPSFDTDAASWTSSAGGTKTRDTTAGHYDTSPAGLRWDKTGASDAFTASYVSLLGNYGSGTFYAGITYVAEIKVKAGAAGGTLDVLFGATYDYASATVTPGTGGFSTCRVTWTPLATVPASSVTLGLNTRGVGGWYYLDSVLTYATRPTIVERNNFRRTKTLNVSFTLTTAAATQLGDLWLRAHQRTPFKGTVKLTGHGAIRDILTGTPLPVDALLDMTGELIRFTDRIDPDTGAVGRDARIAEVSIDPDTDEATVTLDNTRAGFDALLARLDVVLGQNQSR